MCTNSKQHEIDTNDAFVLSFLFADVVALRRSLDFVMPGHSLKSLSYTLSDGSEVTVNLK